MVRLIFLFLYIFISSSFGYYDNFHEVFKVEKIKQVENNKECIYLNDNTKNYIFCNVKLVPCSNKPGIGFYKYKDKVDKAIYLYQPKNPSKEDFIYIYSLIQCESGQDPFKISIDNGYGLFQITTGKVESLDVEENSKKGILLLRKIYLYVNTDFINYKYQDDKSKDLMQFYILRIYNGGSKQLINYHLNYKDKSTYFSTMICYYKASKYTKRYPCFEKVNIYYPYKIMILTSPVFRKYVF